MQIQTWHTQILSTFCILSAMVNFMHSFLPYDSLILFFLLTSNIFAAELVKEAICMATKSDDQTFC